MISPSFRAAALREAARLERDARTLRELVGAQPPAIDGQLALALAPALAPPARPDGVAYVTRTESPREARERLSRDERARRVVDAIRQARAPIGAADIAVAAGLSIWQTYDGLQDVIPDGAIVVANGETRKAYRAFLPAPAEAAA